MSGTPSFDAVSLAPIERVPTRPFSDHEATVHDLGVLATIRTAQRAPMRAERTHADAIGRASVHSHSLRLHRGTLTGRGNTEAIDLATTPYLGFDTTPPWRAVRTA